jgi:hypothetical protein
VNHPVLFTQVKHAIEGWQNGFRVKANQLIHAPAIYLEELRKESEIREALLRHNLIKRRHLLGQQQTSVVAQRSCLTIAGRELKLKGNL